MTGDDLFNVLNSAVDAFKDVGNDIDQYLTDVENSNGAGIVHDQLLLKADAGVILGATGVVVGLGLETFGGLTVASPAVFTPQGILLGASALEAGPALAAGGETLLGLSEAAHKLLDMSAPISPSGFVTAPTNDTSTSPATSNSHGLEIIVPIGPPATVMPTPTPTSPVSAPTSQIPTPAITPTPVATPTPAAGLVLVTTPTTSTPPAPTANGFDGDQVSLTTYYPNIAPANNIGGGSATVTPGTATFPSFAALENGVNGTRFTDGSLTLSGDTMTFLYSPSEEGTAFYNAAFTGYDVQTEATDPAITAASIISTNIPGLTATDLSFSDHAVDLNVAGLTLPRDAPGSIVLGFSFAGQSPEILTPVHT